MPEYTKEQQGIVSELACKKIRMCLGWRDRMRQLRSECDDTDVAVIFSDVAGKFAHEATELIDLVENGGSSEVIGAALQRDQMAVLGTDHQYTEEAVYAFREQMAAMFDVEPECRRDDEDDY